MPSADPIPWSAVPLAQRVAWLTRFRRIVASREDRLVNLIMLETRKPRHEALLHDLAPFLAACKWLEGQAAGVLAPRVLRGSPFWLLGTRVVERRVALGKVAIIATWNYPVHLLGVQLIEALVAGNSVVVKPSERSPQTQLYLLQLAFDAGLPPGVLSWVGPGREVGANLLTTQRFDHVLFTGSTEVGQRVAATLARTLTPATLELTGRDSAIVLEDADRRRAARAIWAGVCLNAGQTCLGPRRALVHEKVYDEFVKQLAVLAAAAPVREMIDEFAAQRCKDLVAKATKDGAKDISTLAERLPAREGEPSTAELNRYFRPTALIDCALGAEVIDGRHFGPLLAVVKVANTEDAIIAHRHCDQHLAVSIFAGDTRAAQALGDRLGTSSVFINDCVVPAAHPAVSVGGQGASGMGFSRGSEGLLALTRPVYVSTGRHSAALLSKTPSKFLVTLLARYLRLRYGARKAPKSAPEPAKAVPSEAAQPGAAAEKLPDTFPMPEGRLPIVPQAVRVAG